MQISKKSNTPATRPAINYFAIPGLTGMLPKKEKIENLLLNLLNFTPQEYKAKCRKRELVDKRQLIQAFLHLKYHYSQHETGKTANRNHATVLHACRTVENRFLTEKPYRLMVQQIELRLNNVFAYERNIFLNRKTKPVC